MQLLATSSVALAKSNALLAANCTIKGSSALQVVNSISLALGDLTKESEIIMGVYAKSQPYFLTNCRKGSLRKRGAFMKNDKIFE